MNTKSTSENATIDRIIEGAFLHAMDSSLTDENQEAARKLATGFYGAEVPEGSPLMILAKGFILGMNEGLHVAEVIDSCAD